MLLETPSMEGGEAAFDRIKISRSEHPDQSIPNGTKTGVKKKMQRKGSGAPLLTRLISIERAVACLPNCESLAETKRRAATVGRPIQNPKKLFLNSPDAPVMRRPRMRVNLVRQLLDSRLYRQT